jgi:hypothetical protein
MADTVHKTAAVVVVAAFLKNLWGKSHKFLGHKLGTHQFEDSFALDRNLLEDKMAGDSEQAAVHLAQQGDQHKLDSFADLTLFKMNERGNTQGTLGKRETKDLITRAVYERCE